MESTLTEYSYRVQIPAKAIADFLPLRYVTLPFADMIQRASVKCKQSPVYEVFDRYFHIPLPIVTKHELGLLFSPKNFPIKFGTNPSTIVLVIVITDRHTDRQADTKPTPVAFAGIKRQHNGEK